ncbi:hypothetical protein BN1708_020576, partial [Verticillium longisporum]
GGYANGGASLAPPSHDHRSGSGSDGRSPERRGGGQHRQTLRSQSRNPGRRNRSNTARGQNGAPP